MSRAHRVRTHHWRLGRLEVKDRIFETLSEALAFAESVEAAESVKVFNHDNEITHDLGASSVDTYA
jgi:hypothetical protein